MHLEGRRALVTGGAGGLGQELCLQLARAGVDVCVSDINEAGARATAQQIGEAGYAATSLRLDVTDSESIRGAAEWCAGRGGLDILINNAGIVAMGTLAESSNEQWLRVLEVNLLSMVKMTRAFLPLLESASSACVVNIASVAGFSLLPGTISYNVSKAAVIAFSESLRLEQRESSVRVVCVCPGLFKSGLVDAGLDLTEKQRKQLTLLTSRSPVPASGVAKATLKAIRRSTFLVVTHPGARVAVFFHRFFPRLYLRLVSRGLRHVKQDADAGGA